MNAFNFTDIIPDDPDPLRLAEDRVAEAEAVFYAAKSDPNLLDYELENYKEALARATADLAALRRRLAAQADEPLPYR